MHRRNAPLPAALCVLLALSGAVAAAATYDVGPDQPYASIGAVPWASLGPGDLVRIHWRDQPYREKWVICRQGTAAAPIVVRGVPGPAGELPVVDGDRAVTAPGLDYWSEGRGVIKIGGANTPPDTMPRHIVLENLDIRGARAEYSFTDDVGATRHYGDNAAPIYLEKGEHVTIRGCALHDGGNGLFVASASETVSREILVEGNHIYDNGNAGSAYEHNSYTAAIGITFQHNRYGPLRDGALGTALKDRSAGLVVRYNWIEGGNRQLDLVDAEDSGLIATDPSYATTHVYGNVLIEPDGAGNRQVVHYGGDSGHTASYRKGMLYLYNNTVVSERIDRTTLLRLSTNDERCDARNNIVYTAAAPGDSLALLDAHGVLDWTHNWTKPGWTPSFSGSFDGTLNDDGTTVETAAPGFRDEAARNYRLVADSACRDAGISLAPAVLPEHDVVRQYREHRDAEPRPRDDTFDIGAWEFAFRVAGLVIAADRETVRWSAHPDALTYDVVRGDVGALRAGAGDFAGSLTACVENDSPDAATSDPFVPAHGAASYLLARPNDASGGGGSYDAGGERQAGSRDPDIAASPAACPPS
jgi:hypothetical protein